MEESGFYGGPCKTEMRPSACKRAKKGSPVKFDCGLSSTNRNASLRLSRVKLFLLAASVAAFIAPSAAFADATLSPGLRDEAAANPAAVFKVIVQGQPGDKSSAIGRRRGRRDKGRPALGVTRQLPLDRRRLRRADRSADSQARQQPRDRGDHRGHTGPRDELALERPALALFLGGGAALADVLELIAQGAHDRHRRFRHRIRAKGFREPGPGCA